MNINQLRKLLDHNSLEEGYESFIRDFELYFGGLHPFYEASACAQIKQKSGGVVYGRTFMINQNQIQKLTMHYESMNKTLQNVVVYDEHGNSKNGYTYKSLDDNISWQGHPNNTFMYEVYLNYLNRKIQNLVVYDNDGTKRGVYDGQSYQEEDNEYVENGDLNKENVMENYIPITNKKKFKFPGRTNLFLAKLQERQPNLFFSKKQGKYATYARTCDWLSRRHPVILTQKEKQYLDQYHPGSYDKAVEYGYNPSQEKFWYICPRYWNILENVPMKPENVDPETVIDPAAKQTDLTQKYVYEFRHPDKEYINKKPGFMDPSKHPEGHYMPCCFGEEISKKLQGVTNIEERKKIVEKLRKDEKLYNERIKGAEEMMERLTDGVENGDEDVNRKLLQTLREERIQSQTHTEKKTYIIDRITFPLNYGRIGMLPLNLEIFLGQNSDKCFSSVSSRKMKPDHPCLFRYGCLNEDTTQSFLSAFSSVFFNGKSSISEFVRVIQTKINIDNILQFHNGNIVKVFADKDKVMEENIEIYKDFKMYKILYNETNDHKQLKTLINGTKNFMKYLSDSNELIDYTYLWDIVCSGVLYENKTPINLVVIQDMKDDMTNNLGILCPSSEYSNYVYNNKKQTVILYERNGFYEPLVYVKKRSTKQKDQIISFYLEGINSELDHILKNIDANRIKHCRGRLNKSDYELEHNIQCDEFLAKYGNSVKESNYKFVSQVINQDSRNIGLTLEKDGKNFYLPLRPGSLIEGVQIVVLNDDLWIDYESTKGFLNEIYTITSGGCKVQPKFKYVDEKMVVGILTHSNQFLSINPPVPEDFDDEVKAIYGKNLVKVDQELVSDIESKRTTYIHKMKLEKTFTMHT